MNQPNDTCGCCAGVTNATPETPSNAPGQSQLAWRVGTQASFKASMLASAARQPGLAGLRTRADDDPAIGLIDAWATALDVLTFYDERIANEAYLRTAGERRSVLELARAIGYELSPGVAASVDLAFTVESAPGAPASVQAPIGLRAQSIPAQDELPQTFETLASAELRPEWNALRPRQTEAFFPRFGDTHLYLQGTATNLKPGDALLLIGDERLGDAGSERWDCRRISSVTPEPQAGRTRISWSPGLGIITGDGRKILPTARNPRVFALRNRAALFGHNAPDPADIIDASSVRILQAKREDSAAGTNEVVLAAHGMAMLDPLPATPDSRFEPDTTIFFLDTVQPQITAESWIVLASPAYSEVYRVKGVAETSLARYHITGKASRLVVEGENADRFTPRTASVLCVSEELAVAEAPITTSVAGEHILLERAVSGLTAGRRLLLTGLPEGSDTPTSEAIELLGAVAEGGLTRLDLRAPLQRSYQRDTVRINANVVPASHGESKREILGSGNAALAGQAFVLKGVPLTYTSAATPSGSLSSLQIRIDGLLWQETPGFYGATAGERRYTVRLADDGKATVRFGDGEQGVRLPSGTENIEARYRVGTGAAGLLKAEQISLLMDRVLGLKSVINPLAPVGAEDPETLARARANAPVTVLTLERIVSLSDFADFARSFAGIAKAAATWLWDGERRLVHLSIAGENGTLLAASSAPYQNLLAAIERARDPNQPLRLGNYRPVACRLAAQLHVAADVLPDSVLAAARSALLDRFAFAARELAQGITASEVIALLQGVAGVTWVDLDSLDRAPGNTLQARLPARAATWSGSDILGAELLTLAAADLALTVHPT